MSQHLCTATLFYAKCSAHCSVLLCTNAVQLCSGQNAIPTVQGCSAMKAHSMQCFIAVTPMEICCTYRCAVTQHKCSAALVRAKCSPHCSVLLRKTGSRQALCHCSHTYGDLLFVQVCSDPAPTHCSTDQGRTASLLFSAALQNGLTACLCYCNYTCGDLLFIQVCSDPAPTHCSTVQGKKQYPLFSVAAFCPEPCCSDLVLGHCTPA